MAWKPEQIYLKAALSNGEMLFFGPVPPRRQHTIAHHLKAFITELTGEYVVAVTVVEAGEHYTFRGSNALFPVVRSSGRRTTGSR